MAGMLEGKSALITGGGGGIGRATALIFAREGARVAISDFVAETAAETVALINAAGGQAMSVNAEVTDAAQVAAMIKTVVAAYGRLDCAFNNAGIAGFQVDAAGKKTHEWSEAAFDRMIAVNLKGVWLCMAAETAADGGAGRRGDRQHRVDRGTDRPAHLVGLCRRQARRDRPDQDRGSGIRRRQYPGECCVSRLHPHAHDRGHDAPARRRVDGPGTVPSHGHAGGDRGNGRLAVLRPRVLRHWRRL